MNDVQGVLHMLDLKSCSIVAVYQLDHGLVCRDEDGLQREKRSTFSFDTLSCNDKAKRPFTPKLDTLPSGENFSPVHSISWLSAWSLKEEKGPLSKDLSNENNYNRVVLSFKSPPEIVEFDGLGVDARGKDKTVGVESCHRPTSKLHQTLGSKD